MTVVLSHADTAIVNFATQLRARAGLAGVKVFEEPQQSSLLGLEWIVVAMRVDADMPEPESMGAFRLEEVFTLKGALGTSLAGAGDTDSRTLRQRAYALLMSEVFTQLRTDWRLNGAVSWCWMSRWEYEPSATPELRVAQIRFDVTCIAQLTLS